MKMPKPEAARTRFHDVRKQIEEIEAKSAPLRARRDELVNAHAEEILSLEGQYLAIEKPLFDLKQDLAGLSRFLGGRTGEPASSEA